MQPSVPPPPRGEGGLGTSAPGPPTSALAETLVPSPTQETRSSEQISSESVHTVPSEEDVLMYGKKVHVHGALAGHTVPHPPHHHDPHAAVNYAKAAKEEMHELHEHPPAVAKALLPGAKTGVEEWDKVEEELPTRRPRGKEHHRDLERQPGPSQ